MGAMSVCNCQRSTLASRLLCVSAFCTAVTFISGVASAQPPEPQQAVVEPQFVVWGAYGDSDNIARSAALESGTYRSLGLLLGLQRSAARLDASIDADLEYRSYSDDALENESLGTLNGQALVDLVQDRFAWNFEGYLDQAQRDPFAARGPTNRETTISVSTGPRLDIPFGRTSLGVSASRSAERYEDSTYADRESDDYQVALSRQVRRATAFALVAGSGETEYVDGAAPSYRIDQLFLRIDRTLPNSSLNADLGTNEIASDTQSRRDPLFDVSWNRSLSDRSTFGVTATRGFTDAGDIGIGGTALVTTAPSEQKALSFDYNVAADRMNFGVGAILGEEDYAGGTTIDNDYESATFRIDGRVSPRLDMGFLFVWYDREYLDGTAPATSQDRTAGVWLNRSLGPRFSIAFDVSRYEAADIEETRWEVRFMYSPLGRTSGAMGSTGR
jgi:hypothetical protein